MHKSKTSRKLFMERLDPTTNAHIVEEAPGSLPTEATQWIFEGGVPFITYGCKRLNVGKGIHKKDERPPDRPVLS